MFGSRKISHHKTRFGPQSANAPDAFKPGASEQDPLNETGNDIWSIASSEMRDIGMAGIKLFFSFNFLAVFVSKLEGHGRRNRCVARVGPDRSGPLAPSFMDLKLHVKTVMTLTLTLEEHETLKHYTEAKLIHDLCLIVMNSFSCYVEITRPKKPPMWYHS